MAHEDIKFFKCWNCGLKKYIIYIDEVVNFKGCCENCGDEEWECSFIDEEPDQEFYP